jgi:hypothetical protein
MHIETQSTGKKVEPKTFNANAVQVRPFQVGCSAVNHATALSSNRQRKHNEFTNFGKKGRPVIGRLKCVSQSQAFPLLPISRKLIMLTLEVHSHPHNSILVMQGTIEKKLLSRMFLQPPV